jgi:isocitrate dehydrogenase
MDKGDFYANEKSAVMKEATDVSIEIVKPDGSLKVLKESTPLLPGEVIDGTFMDVRELCDYYEREMEDAKATNIMFSLHLKATMMKVSDPIMFGHAVRTFFKDAFEKHAEVLEEIGVQVNDGLGSVLKTVNKMLPPEKAKDVCDAFEKCYESRPWLAMVNSDKGITNLHVPSDIIIDNSMPVLIRDSGKMWNKLGNLEDAKCCIPDRSYATTYQDVIAYVKTHGQFDAA